MSLVLAPLVFYPAIWFGKKLRLLSKSSQQEMAQMANILYEAFTGNRIVKAFGMEKTEAGRVRKVTQRIFHLNLRQKMTHSLSSPLMEILGVLLVSNNSAHLIRQPNDQHDSLRRCERVWIHFRFSSSVLQVG
jgi:ABC-type multidrug transport system fused ATPase/permease subunit